MRDFQLRFVSIPVEIGAAKSKLSKASSQKGGEGA